VEDDLSTRKIHPNVSKNQGNTASRGGSFCQGAFSDQPSPHDRAFSALDRIEGEAVIPRGKSELIGREFIFMGKEGIMRSITIGQLARKGRVNVETIRYYERRGLIPEPPRRESGYRQYSQDAVARIHFIKRAKELGFSLKEISELLFLRVDPYTTCGDVKKRAEVKIADIEEKIRDLQRMKEALNAENG
jgi:MerR family mercuric resistance operon transcriptional regulator